MDTERSNSHWENGRAAGITSSDNKRRPTPVQTSSSVPDRPMHINQCPTSPTINGYEYVLPVVMKSLFHVTGSVPIDVGHLPLQARPTVWNFLPENMRDPEVSD